MLSFDAFFTSFLFLEGLWSNMQKGKRRRESLWFFRALLDLISFIRSRENLCFACKILKFFLSIKFFQFLFLFLHCLSYHLLVIYACWFFTFVTSTAEMLVKFLRIKPKKTHKFPFLLSPFYSLLQRPSRNKKRSKKGIKGKHCKQINKEQVGLRLPHPSSPIWGKLVSSPHFHALFHNLLKVG